MSSSSDSKSAAAGGGATAKSENELSDTVADDKGNGEVSEFDVLKDVGEWLESRERGSSGEESGVHAEPIIEAENDVPFETENKEEEGGETDRESI